MFLYTLILVGRDSSVDCLGIESWWGRDFSAPVQTGPGVHPASCTMGTGSFPGYRVAGAWCWPLTPF